jgi:glycogen synthase
MRIALPTTQYVTEHSFAGGLANYLHRLALSLTAEGHEPLILVAAENTEDLVCDGIPVRRVKVPQPNRLLRILRTGSPHREPWLSHVLNRELARLHRTQAFDLVQYPSYRALGLFRLRTVAAVVRLSSFRPLWYKGLEADPEAAPQQRSARFELTAMERADAVYAPSRFLADKVTEATGVQVGAIHPPFSMDVDAEDPALAQKAANAGEYLLFVGYLSTIKGIPDLAAVLEDLLDSFPSFRFLFAGSDRGCGSSNCADLLKSSAGQHSDRVDILGTVRHSRLYPLIRHARAVVLPSRVDNLPNTCLESMALGQVVVGPNGASFDELIEDGVSGILFKPGSSEDLTNALHKAIHLSERDRLRIGQEAKKKIDSLRPELTVPHLVDFYSQVIANSRTGRR